MNNIQIHPSAEVDPSAEIGQGTRIWHQSQVMPNSKVGTNCNIGKCVYIDSGVKIGDRVKIQNGVSVYRGVQVEDDCFLGPHMVFTNDLNPRAFNDNFTVTPTLIKKGASIGANATLICGIIIGEYSMIGAGSVVTKDVPAYSLVVGNPAKEIGKVCKCGLRINDLEPTKCTKCNQ